MLWAVVWFASLFAGAVLMAIATRGSPDAPVEATASFPGWVLRTSTILIGFPLGTALTIDGFTSFGTGGTSVLASAIRLLLGTTILAAAILAVMSKKGR